MPKAVVNVAPGKSIIVKVPCRSRNPCDPLESSQLPMMSPRSLMPRAALEDESGQSMVV
jgi:hypothetical protein